MFKNKKKLKKQLEEMRSKVAIADLIIENNKKEVKIEEIENTEITLLFGDKKAIIDSKEKDKIGNTIIDFEQLKIGKLSYLKLVDDLKLIVKKYEKITLKFCFQTFERFEEQNKDDISGPYKYTASLCFLKFMIENLKLELKPDLEKIEFIESWGIAEKEIDEFDSFSVGE